jgi:hypothetical protein
LVKTKSPAAPSNASRNDVQCGHAEHIMQRVNLAVVAKAPLARILAHAEKRGWRRLRLLSSARNTCNRDYFGETPDGAQMPMLNVFRRNGNVIRHFWGSELLYAPTDPGQDPRHTDSIDPLWNLFDFTPEGRGTAWYPDLSYSWPGPKAARVPRRGHAGERGPAQTGLRGPLVKTVGFGRMKSMDEDLEQLGRDQLIVEIRKLRAGIRKHRAGTKHELCWHHPQL